MQFCDVMDILNTFLFIIKNSFILKFIHGFYMLVTSMKNSYDIKTPNIA